MVNLGLWGLLGLSPYAYLPLAAYFNPTPGGWGHVTSAAGLWHHLRRGDYGSLRLYSGGSGSEGTRERIARWFDDWAERQAPLPGTPSLIPALALAGSFVLFFHPIVVATLGALTQWKRGGSGPEALPKKRGKKAAPPPLPSCMTKEALFTDAYSSNDGHLIGPALVASLVVYLVVFHFLANMPLDNPLLFGIHARFWMQPNLLASIFVGVGIDAACYATSWVLALPLPKEALPTSAETSPSSPANTGPRARARGAGGLVLCASVGVFLVGAQLRRSFVPSDQSQNRVFEGYAAAILDPLPPESILLINYDQQWTSVRYRAVCEGGGQPNVTTLNLAMMTFEWWKHKRVLYPHVEWPGTHYTREAALDGGFSFEAFVAANMQRFPSNSSNKSQISK